MQCVSLETVLVVHVVLVQGTALGFIWVEPSSSIILSSVSVEWAANPLSHATPSPTRWVDDVQFTWACVIYIGAW